jgi:hypothetical protein
MTDIGETSDGYHTFNELYDHRITLFIALCYETHRHLPMGQVTHVWRSRLHSDGSAIDGWFVMGMGFEPGLQITYHLPNARWAETNWLGCELERAPAWDGHTAPDVIKRLKRIYR